MSVFTQKATNRSGGDGNGNYEPPPADDHVARLVALIDLGTHTDDYMGERKDLRKILFVWELVDCPRSDGTGNHMIGKDYNVSFGQKANLRKMVEKWSNKTFDDGAQIELGKMLGKPFYLSLIHKKSQAGKTYAIINDVSHMPKGLPCADATVEPYVWEFDEVQPFEPPAWLPYLYGAPVSTMIDAAHESRPAPPPRRQQTAQPVTQQEADAWASGQKDEVPF